LDSRAPKHKLEVTRLGQVVQNRFQKMNMKKDWKAFLPANLAGRNPSWLQEYSLGAGRCSPQPPGPKRGKVPQVPTKSTTGTHQKYHRYPPKVPQVLLGGARCGTWYLFSEKIQQVPEYKQTIRTQEAAHKFLEFGEIHTLGGTRDWFIRAIHTHFVCILEEKSPQRSRDYIFWRVLLHIEPIFILLNQFCG
jgi:hypothetical protein